MRKIITILAAVMILSVASMGAVGAADETDERVIIGFKEGFDRADQELLIKGYGGEVSHSYSLINASAARTPSKSMVKLEKNLNVKYIECDYTVHATTQEVPWGVDRIGAPVVHGYNKGNGIKVAIIDTGIDYNHPDLNANYKGGYDFVNKDNDPMDDNGHGTHCAGIIGAADNDEGVIGVAPEVHLHGVKVLNSGGSGSYSNVIAGIEWSVDNDMQVISMSLGGNSYSQALQEACDMAHNNGVLLVAAAGNDGNYWWGGYDSVDYPARYDRVIAVAATDSNDERPYWSSQGPAVELAAPGVSIYSTCWDDTYTTKQGTSMACPHVSGTAALVMASDPTLSNVAVRERLQTTADDLGTPGRDNLYGFGIVDADEAAPSTGNTPPVADAGLDQTAVVDEVVTFDGSGSSDPDGTIVSYEWDFGDEVTGTGETTTHAYSSPDTYTVTLIVTDDDGATDTDTVIVTVTAASPTNTMHVDSIDMELNHIWAQYYYATAIVTIVDATNNPVGNAAVSYHWEDATNGQGSIVTDSTGRTPLLYAVSKASSGTTFTFVVDDVTKEGWAYDPDANEETSDSVTVP